MEHEIRRKKEIEKMNKNLKNNTYKNEKIIFCVLET